MNTVGKSLVEHMTEKLNVAETPPQDGWLWPDGETFLPVQQSHWRVIHSEIAYRWFKQNEPKLARKWRDEIEETDDSTVAGDEFYRRGIARIISTRSGSIIANIGDGAIEGTRVPLTRQQRATLKDWGIFSRRNVVLDEAACQFLSLFEARPYKPRSSIPGWRGELTQDKILRILKTKVKQSASGPQAGWMFVKDFETPEELAAHTYWHGSGSGVPGGLKPSITMSDKEVERVGGGGYGDKYWGISLSKSKRMASHFSGQSSSVGVYMVVLHKDAVVKEMLEVEDANEMEDHIVQLWEEGVDAVWIGGGEEELVVLNPKAVWIGPSEYFRVFNMKLIDNPSADELWQGTRGFEGDAEVASTRHALAMAQKNVDRWVSFRAAHPNHNAEDIDARIAAAKERLAGLQK